MPWEWLQAALLLANLVWTTLCLGGYRAETAVFTLALTGALLVVHFSFLAVSGISWRSLHVAPACLLPFLLYALGNVLAVSPVPWLGWKDWLSWAQMLAVFAVVLNGIRSSGPRQVLFFGLVALGLVGVFLGGYQRFVQPQWLMMGRVQASQFFERASGSFGIPNSLAGWLILLLPATGALTLRRGASALARVWWGWVTLAFAFGLVLTVSRGAWLALALALACWPLLTPRWSWRRRATGALLAIAGIGSLAAIIFTISPGAEERLARLVADGGERSRPILWRAAGELFRERPLVGSGAGSFNIRFEQHRPAGFLDEPEWVHNDYLNTLSDYGAAGLGLLLGGVAFVLWQRRRNRSHAARGSSALASLAVVTACGIGLLAFLFQLFVDFHLKISALGLAFATLGALWLDPWPEPLARLRGAAWPSRCAWAAMAVAVVPLTLRGLNLTRAEAVREAFRPALVRFAGDPVPAPDIERRLDAAETALRDATRLAPAHGGVWSELAFALQLRAFIQPAAAPELGVQSEAAARQALARSPVVPEFWIRLGVALDMQGRREEARAAFLRAIEQAPRHPHTWYYYAHHLSRDRAQQAAAREAIANCLALDPGNRAAEALRETLNARR